MLISTSALCVLLSLASPPPMDDAAAIDRAIRAVTERHAQVGTLLTAGKIAWDASDYATAAGNWEGLLRLPKLDPEVDRLVRPLAAAARKRAGGQPRTLVAEAAATASPNAPSAAPLPGSPMGAPHGMSGTLVTVSGTVAGGGSIGPGGTVVWLKRTDGRTPKPAPSRGKLISQDGKTFSPRVLPVTVGSKVEFRNKDDIFHNVFSISRPNDFDAGLFKKGESYAQTFVKPGPVQLLCNIHASMIGYVVVLDTPWYAQADASGAFSIRGVPPGEYQLEAWHEGSSTPSKSPLSVTGDGMHDLQVRVAGDRKAPSTVPDKYGKPRQAQLGY